MSKYARINQLQNSLVYHIYNRSNYRRQIFCTHDDYRYFMKLLADYSRKFELKIYHWVIMPNHYHILAELNQPKAISKIMAGINHAYTCYYHRSNSTYGFLWQGRFKSQPVQKERYLIACGRYIERNPVRAGIVAKSQDYHYSSAQLYCLGQTDGISTEDPSFIALSEDPLQRRQIYREFLLDFDSQEEKYFLNFEAPAGSKDFNQRQVKKSGHCVLKRRGKLRKNRSITL